MCHFLRFVVLFVDVLWQLGARELEDQWTHVVDHQHWGSTKFMQVEVDGDVDLHCMFDAYLFKYKLL